SEARVRVIVVERYGVDLAEQVLVELVHICGRIRARLGAYHAGQSEGQQSHGGSMKQTFHLHLGVTNDVHPGRRQKPAPTEMSQAGTARHFTEDRKSTRLNSS